MDRFTYMQTFLRVVEAGSITGAADRMGVVKSVVSRRLADLEAHLGVELFHRTTRRLTLTDTGRSFYERCGRILADLEEAEQAVSREHGALRGRLRVAAPHSFGLRHLTPAITGFMTRHPGVVFELDFNDRQVDLLQEGFDMAVRIARLADSSLIARRIAPIRQVVCASPAYLAQHGVPRQPEDLKRHACLAYANSPEPDTWTYRTPGGGEGTVTVPVHLAANSGDFLTAAAVAGHGVVLEPTFIVYDAIRQGRLRPVLENYEWPGISAYAVYPHTRHLSSRVRAFVDFLVECFAGVPYWDRPAPGAGASPGPA
ncbi:MAG: LysR family transcriptional regulator [Chromatiales bacterium 21-64-14]|nr:MAG: LysR family transcriptional regulator [Chromatiales bacterium 21-64-14]HQU14671.1 LysR family transcriptional regulator [Gammaproteobacteria bacterium]